jgi:lysophospholipase L1-like esterase
VKVPIGESATFTYNGNTTKFYTQFSAGVEVDNAVIAISVKDITSTILPTGVKQVKLSGYNWKQGKHTTRGHSITSPDSATNTLCMLESIPYNPNMYFVLKSGYTVAFASVENNLVTGIAAAYITTVGRIDMIDVYNNMGKAAANVFGDSLVIMIRDSSNSNITLQDVDIDDAIEMYVVDKGSATKPKTWVAIGDSIIDGRCTILDGSTVRAKTNHYCQYGYIVSKLLGIDTFTEMGYGGMGYVNVANDGTYLTDVLAMDLGNPDIITVNLGVNDRSQDLGDENSTANDGTISGAIRNCCEVLGASYPNAHIVFMTPINAWSTGTLSTGWCKRSGTTHLSDIADMIKYWCGLYGFPVIDMLNESPINDFNIKTHILDKLHPTMEAHYMLGHYLAGVLPYNQF